MLESSKDGKTQSEFKKITLTGLVYRFIFQLTAWSDLDTIQANGLSRIILSLLNVFYRKRGNTFSLAGWPLVTQIGGDQFQTSIYSLEASIVKRSWLLDAPFDEVLDPHGIGDNYGVATQFPGKRPITVLTTAHIIHHRSNENRLTPHVAYFRRILALHYFMNKNHNFSLLNRVFLIWSLVGNYFIQLIRRDHQYYMATLKAIKLIMTGQNPYVIGSLNGSTHIIPEL